MNITTKLLLTAIFIGAFAAAKAQSQDIEYSTKASHWEYRLSPYLWLAGVKGQMATVPGLPSAPIDISPKESINDSHISAMVLFEAKYDSQGILVDYMYSDVRSDDELDAEMDFVIGSKSKTTIVSTAYVHEIFDDKNTVIDLFAGIRYWHMETTLDISGDDAGDYNGVNVNHSETWLDPLIGIKAKSIIYNSDFYLSGGLTVGGFSIGADKFYDASLNLGYRWNDAISTTLGYRVYDLDYKSYDFEYDAKQQGWVLGLTWGF